MHVYGSVILGGERLCFDMKLLLLLSPKIIAECNLGEVMTEFILQMLIII